MDTMHTMEDAIDTPQVDKCPLCHEEVRSQIRHDRDMHDTICTVQFTLPSGKKTNHEVTRDANGLLRCPHCSRTYPKASSLKYHTRMGRCMVKKMRAQAKATAQVASTSYTKPPAVPSDAPKRRHLKRVLVTFYSDTGDKTIMQVSRSAKGYLYCPRCSRPYLRPKSLQEHTRRGCMNSRTPKAEDDEVPMEADADPEAELSDLYESEEEDSPAYMSGNSPLPWPRHEESEDEETFSILEKFQPLAV